MPLHRQYLLFVVLVLVHVLDSVCAAVSETPYRPSARVKEYHDFSKGWKALKKNKGGGVVYILYVYVLSLARALSPPPLPTHFFICPLFNTLLITSLFHLLHNFLLCIFIFMPTYNFLNKRVSLVWENNDFKLF